jgi:hypothetical protein
MSFIARHSIHEVLDQLSRQRPVFYSEADFQHSLAWAIQTSYPSAQIRLEVPFSRAEAVGHLDCLVHIEHTSLAIELKYKTRDFEIIVGNEKYVLKSQSAQDLGRYDFFRDVERLEHLALSSERRVGLAIFLTNDSSYWKPPGRPQVAYRDFRMQDGRTVTGRLSWGESASPGTMLGRESDIVLSGRYTLEWRGYSDFKMRGYSRFRYLVLRVGESVT